MRWDDSPETASGRGKRQIPLGAAGCGTLPQVRQVVRQSLLNTLHGPLQRPLHGFVIRCLRPENTRSDLC